MRSLNRVQLIGRLGKNPEVRYTSNGSSVANFTMATNESWIGKDGQKNERTEWHNIVAWGKLGEICGEYLTKGKQIYIEGRLTTRSWEDRDGKKRYTTEVKADNMIMLGGPGASPGASHTSPENDSTIEDDIPF
ncbi:MAG: single-stranded DNA-binding protein [Deltaproteobacteria bacterium]|nr:single-stranded DNA-binding protein [Deltaproteobacteria bacterium]